MDFDLIVLVKPVSAFKHTNPLAFQLFLYVLGCCCTIYQCKRSQFINVSHTDKLRGIMPCIYAVCYCIHFLFHNGTMHCLLFLMTCLSLFWGLHHTLILWERNYLSISHDKEDYRWTAIRTFFGPPWQWQLFTVLFVNLYHHFIYFSIVNCPFYFIYHISSSWHVVQSCGVLVCLWLVLFAYLCVADWQMYCFQKYKKSEAISGKYLRHTNKQEFVVVDGTFNGWKWDFIDSGLWRFSRHPNYFAEIMVWAVVAVIAICADADALSEQNFYGVVVNTVDPLQTVAALFGCGNLALWMWQLAKITDKISDIKYPCYQWKMATTNALLPWLPGDRTQVMAKTSKSVSHADVEELYIYA